MDIVYLPYDAVFVEKHKSMREVPDMLVAAKLLLTYPARYSL